MRIIDRVDEVIKEKGLTAKELAQNIGVSTGNVTDWRKGRSKPSAEVVAKIARYLGVSTDYLHGLSDERNSTASPSVVAFHKNTPGDFTEDEKEEISNFIEFLISKRDKKDN